MAALSVLRFLSPPYITGCPGSCMPQSNMTHHGVDSTVLSPVSTPGSMPFTAVESYISQAVACEVFHSTRRGVILPLYS
jgi:hypothetical protein